MPNFRASVGHGPFIHVKRANPVTLSGQDVGLTVGGGVFSYTPTHYVAPFASVSGATDDYNDLGASAYSAATSSGTPTTLGTAMARAVAPHKVRVGPGTYIGALTGNRFTPSFRAVATNSTAVDRLVFFAQYPAASNYGSTSLYSKLRLTTATDLTPVLGPAENSHYIVFDGLYVDETDNARSARSGGILLFHLNTGCEYRRCVVDRGSGVVGYGVGYNAQAFYVEATQNCRIVDCIANGYVVRSDNGSITQPNIEVYNSTGLVIEYCTMDNFGIGMFQKESDSGWSTAATYRYNLFKNGGSCLWAQQGASYDCHHNLGYNVSTGFEGDGGPVAYSGGVRPPLDLNIHHNTFVLRANSTFTSGYGGGGAIVADGMQLVTSQFRDNIIYSKTGMTVNMFRVRDGGSSSWTWPSWTSINNNCYYREDASTLTFTGLAFNPVSGIANWRTETGHETNTITSNPQFVSVVGEDFRLANNGQAALTASSTGGLVGCYETGSEEIGVRANPNYGA